MAVAVFLDRDGVLTRAVVHGGRPHPPMALAQCGSLSGVAAGYRALFIIEQGIGAGGAG